MDMAQREREVAAQLPAGSVLAVLYEQHARIRDLFDLVTNSHGAARQAAWVLAQSTGPGGDGPPDWPGSPAETFTADPRPDIRDRYATLRDDTASWHERKRNS